MKRILNLFLLSIVCLCALQSVFGQQKSFSEVESKAIELRRNKSYRVKTTTEIFGDKDTAPKTKIASVYESLPPASSYYYSTTATGKTTQTTETIRIGEKQYIRKNKGKWAINTSKPLYGLASKNLAEERFIEKATYNNQTVYVYEDKMREMRENKDLNITSRYWFSEEGYLLKAERTETNLDTNEVSRSVSTYEYEPKGLKIVAPIK